jgi:hypothetical protein
MKGKPTALIRKSTQGYQWSLYSATGKRIARSARAHPKLQGANSEINGLIRTLNGKGVVTRANIGTKHFPHTHKEKTHTVQRTPKVRGTGSPTRKATKARRKARSARGKTRRTRA